MGCIKQLSDDLIKKIAAGEVIERPASVVKELVENSIDAGATKIEIEINRAGKHIKVSDNGLGIPPDDIALLFVRHATSKIKRFDDLWNLDSLGFRGEALASISAISKITCKSKNINEEYGFEIKTIDEKVNKKTSAIAIGTIFEIDDLFYNTPARQKFLKSETTELGNIQDIVLPLALSYPKVAIKLINNGSVLFKTTGSNNLKQVIVELLGDDLNEKLIPLSVKYPNIDLTGYISALEVFRSNRKSNFIFVNKRPVKCPIIIKALNTAFEGLLPPGKFPVVVLNLKFAPKTVDINVHPTKKEVRYTHPNEVYNLVLKTIQDSVANYYKEEYKEKSVYSIPETQPLTFSTKPEGVSPSYSGAALELYAPEVLHKPVSEKKEEQQFFSVSNLKSKLINSNKLLTNMTKIGNKTIFEVGLIYENNAQIVFSGEIIGTQDYQKKFFNSLSELGTEVYKTYLDSSPIIQNKLLKPELEDEELKTANRKKPADSILYTIWERDNWTCVYCGKPLLDPKAVRIAVSLAKDAFVTYINKEGKEVTNHILCEHLASYDHFLPVSKLPQFNFEPDNLFACCFECNRKKLDSMELKSWEPKRQNSWTKPLEIAGLIFSKSNTFTENIKV